LNETLLWLVYCISGGVAFVAAYRWHWRPIMAVVVGGLITLIGWLLIFRFTELEQRPQWVRLDLSLNLTFGLIFAAVGAFVGQRLGSRRDRGG